MGVSPRLDELRKRYEENPRRFFAPLANEYRKSGDVERAVDLCQLHLADAPANLSGQIVFGQSLFDAGRYEDARQPFSIAAQLDPENLIALRHLGDIARFLGAPGEAATWYQRVLEADPRNEEIGDLLREMTAAQAPPAAVVPAAPTASPDVAAEATPAPFDADPPGGLEGPDAHLSMGVVLPVEAGDPTDQRAPVGLLAGHEPTAVLSDALHAAPLDDLPVHVIELGEADPFGFAPRPADPLPEDHAVDTSLPTATDAPSLIDIEAAFAMPEVGTFADGREGAPLDVDLGVDMSAGRGAPPAADDGTEFGMLGGAGSDDGVLPPLSAAPVSASADEDIGFPELPETPVDASVDLAPLDESVDVSLGFGALETDALETDGLDRPAEGVTFGASDPFGDAVAAVVAGDDTPAVVEPDDPLPDVVVEPTPGALDALLDFDEQAALAAQDALLEFEPPSTPHAYDDDLLDFGDEFEVPAASATQAEEPSAEETHAEEAPGASSPAPTFATETMAELYVRQGLVAEAIGVYEALLAQRPGDPALLEKLAALRPAAPTPGAADAALAPQPLAVDFFAALVTRQPTGSARGIAALPTAAPVAAEPVRAPGVDDARAAVLAAAFAPIVAATPASVSASRAVTPLTPRRSVEQAVEGQPPVPPTAARSERSAADEAPPPRPSAAITFDQFFAPSPPATPSAPPPPPAPSGSAASDDDFQAWLSGLTKP